MARLHTGWMRQMIQYKTPSIATVLPWMKCRTHFSEHWGVFELFCELCGSSITSLQSLTHTSHIISYSLKRLHTYSLRHILRDVLPGWSSSQMRPDRQVCSFYALFWKAGKRQQLLVHLEQCSTSLSSGWQPQNAACTRSGTNVFKELYLHWISSLSPLGDTAGTLPSLKGRHTRESKWDWTLPRRHIPAVLWRVTWRCNVNEL